MAHKNLIRIGLIALAVAHSDASAASFGPKAWSFFKTSAQTLWSRPHAQRTILGTAGFCSFAFWPFATKTQPVKEDIWQRFTVKSQDNTVNTTKWWEAPNYMLFMILSKGDKMRRWDHGNPQAHHVLSPKPHAVIYVLRKRLTTITPQPAFK